MYNNQAGHKNANIPTIIPPATAESWGTFINEQASLIPISAMQINSTEITSLEVRDNAVLSCIKINEGSTLVTHNPRQSAHLAYEQAE